MATEKAVKDSVRRSKAESFARTLNGYGSFVPVIGLPAGLLIQWVKVPTRLGYVSHQFILRGPTGRKSPMNEGAIASDVIRDGFSGRASDRFDVAYLLGEGTDLNDAARIVRVRVTERCAAENLKEVIS